MGLLQACRGGLRVGVVEGDCGSTRTSIAVEWLPRVGEGVPQCTRERGLIQERKVKLWAGCQSDFISLAGDLAWSAHPEEQGGCPAADNGHHQNRQKYRGNAIYGVERNKEP